MDKDKYKEIENSEEFKKSFYENPKVSSTPKYKNKIASKISYMAGNILVGGVLISVIGSLFIIPQAEDFSIIPIAVIIAVSSVIFSLLLDGLAEIIELLQQIKDK